MFYNIILNLIRLKTTSFLNTLEPVIVLFQQRQLEKAQAKMKNMESDFEQEKTSLTNRKEAEITELKQQLEVNADNLSKQEIQTQAHKQFLDKITLEKEAIQVSSIFKKKKKKKKKYIFVSLVQKKKTCPKGLCRLVLRFRFSH